MGLGYAANILRRFFDDSGDVEPLARRARELTRRIEGDVEGAGHEVRWRPEGPGDRVRVAVRSRGGVAVVSLRAEDVKA